ncbi:MAG: endonuclease/exonuclease/phosphatase family protein [Draconibacterium sp.]
MRKTVRNIILVFNFLVILALVTAYLSVYIPPNQYWIPALFGLAYPFLLLGNIAFAVFWLIFKKRYSLFSLLAILLGFGFIGSFYQFGARNAESGGVKVLSYNVRHFTGGDDKGARKLNAEDFVAFFEEQKADIICLQESRLRKNNIFNLAETVDKLENIKHYQFASSSSTFGSVTMTRFPIVDMGEIRFKDTRNISIFTDVKIEQDTIRVYNIHLQSYHIDRNNYAVLESVDSEEEKRKEAAKVLLKQMRDGWKMRAVQVETIRKHIDESPFPVIVCGDFNDTPTSYSYHTLSENLEDAFVDSGKGVGRTYVGELPSFRIDYILHSKVMKAYNFQTLDFRYSDHLPVSCDLVFEH